ncbi:cysteine desulfurase NifS, partial [Candidatus Bathyarchaeota archaeon]
MSGKDKPKKEHFFMEKRRVVYLDNNATTRVAPEVSQAMLSLLEEEYGNPSSKHFLGCQAAKLVQEARERVAHLLGCHAEEIIFTSCGTEGDNLAIRGIAELLPSNKRHLITTSVEHPAVKNTMEYLRKRGYEISILKVDRDGLIDIEELKSKLRKETGLVSIIYANNETGVILPIEEVGRILKEREIAFHVDAVQAVGKIPICLRESSIDLLTLSGHKLHGPKGIGALYIRHGIQLHPLLLGGNQERGLRGGTEATPAIVGLGKAAELAARDLESRNLQIQRKRDRLEKWILENIPHTRRNGHPT